jgi:hypothetical protein
MYTERRKLHCEMRMDVEKKDDVEGRTKDNSVTVWTRGQADKVSIFDL